MNSTQELILKTVARLMAEGKTEAEAVAEVQQYMVWIEDICNIAKAGDMQAIEYLETATDADAAQGILDACKLLVGFLGGRVLVPGPGKPDYRAQAFFGPAEDVVRVHCGLLPDGCRLVTIPDGQREALGLGNGCIVDVEA